MTTIAPLAKAHLQAAHALNEQFARDMSSVSDEGFADLIALASYARVIGRVDAFLVAFEHSSAYEGAHFRAFQAQFDSFVYVDRIAIAAHAQGLGYARLLYADLFGWARARGQRWVTCEVNIVPANPASQRLHASLAFKDVGQATTGDGSKIVRYLARDLDVA